MDEVSVFAIGNHELEALPRYRGGRLRYRPEEPWLSVVYPKDMETGEEDHQLGLVRRGDDLYLAVVAGRVLPEYEEEL